MSTNKQNKKGKPFKYKKNYNPNNKQKEQEVLPFNVELLELPIEELSLSDFTLELLKKNRINVAADLCRKTEKDMYKIQNLNKKILLEIKKALNEKGMYIKGEGVKEEKEDKPQVPDKKGSKFAVAAAKGTTLAIHTHILFQSSSLLNSLYKEIHDTQPNRQMVAVSSIHLVTQLISNVHQTQFEAQTATFVDTYSITPSFVSGSKFLKFR